MTKFNTSGIQFNFFTLANPDEFRTATILNKIKENKNISLQIFCFKNFSHALRKILNFKNSATKSSKLKNIDVVMYPSHILAIPLKIFRKNYLVLDAGWSLYEGEVTSRRKFGIFFWRGIFYYVLDFVAAHSADLIFLESNLQKDYYAKKFFLKNHKCKVIYTGLDEKKFLRGEKKHNNEFIVIFRGKYNNEAGIEVLSAASYELKNFPIRIWVYMPGIPKEIKFADNTIVRSEFLTKLEISKLLQKSDLSLGQLQNHKRLSRTIPHKAYESAYLSKPYLTARSKGILEIFEENREVLCFTAGDSSQLSETIIQCYIHRKKLPIIGKKMHIKYVHNYSQDKLANQFLNHILTSIDE